MKRRDLEKHLRNHGCVLHHHGSRHDYWFNTHSGNQAPVPRHKEVPQGTTHVICKQLGVPRPAR